MKARIAQEGTDLIAHVEGGSLRLGLENVALLGEAEKLLLEVTRLLGARVPVEGERFPYGYWQVELKGGHEHEWTVWEPTADHTNWVLGTALTLGYAASQRRVCANVDAPFSPPSFSQLAVISQGVMDGDEVQAVRYPSPSHMSGWWITSDRYDGDVNSLVTEHLYHVSAARPDLASLLALPPGFRVAPGRKLEIWFDALVAGQPPL